MDKKNTYRTNLSSCRTFHICIVGSVPEITRVIISVCVDDYNSVVITPGDGDQVGGKRHDKSAYLVDNDNTRHLLLVLLQLLSITNIEKGKLMVELLRSHQIVLYKGKGKELASSSNI